MRLLRSWSVRRIFITALAWIIGVQLVVLWRPLVAAFAAVRADPTRDFSIAAPHIRGGSLILLGPPLVLAALWWWARRQPSSEPR